MLAETLSIGECSCKPSPMDYRQVLRDEFLARKQTDLHYSMRKFAKDLGINYVHLSYVLRGQRGISPEKARQVGAALGLQPMGRQWFTFLVASQSARGKGKKNMARQGLRREYFKTMEPLAFQISDAQSRRK
jgi:uncharacterized protein (TIGR02147 family)